MKQITKKTLWGLAAVYNDYFAEPEYVFETKEDGLRFIEETKTWLFFKPEDLKEIPLISYE